MKTIEIRSWIQIPEDYTGRVIHREAKILTLKNGHIHSFNDEPSEQSSKLNPKDYARFWHKNGKYHRGNGKPAIIYGRDTIHSGDKEQYWINDKEVTKAAAETYAMLFNKEEEKEQQNENNNNWTC